MKAGTNVITPSGEKGRTINVNGSTSAVRLDNGKTGVFANSLLKPFNRITYANPNKEVILSRIKYLESELKRYSQWSNNEAIVAQSLTRKEIEFLNSIL